MTAIQMNDEKQADPTLLSKEEFFARVDEAREQIKQGKSIHGLTPFDFSFISCSSIYILIIFIGLPLFSA